MRYVALFRGINVGGHNKIPMAPLRDTFEGLGFDDVSSIIQSGNVCFTADGAAEVLAATIRSAVADRFSVDVPVLLRSRAEIDGALAAHPFTPGEVEPKLHHIVFLADPAPADTPDRLGDHAPDEYAAIGRELHVRYPQGSGRSKLTADLIDRRLDTIATARNLPTCGKIAAVLAG
jgi:uncharacterized protein (DUF1697 family)